MKEKILIVEDDVDLAEILKIQLSKQGYIVDVAFKRDDILYKSGTYNYDIILLDIMLPDSDGITLCKEIRDIVFCPIIFMSAIDDESYILNSFTSGGDDYVTKPINFNQLFARIEANIRRNKLYSKNISFFFKNYELKLRERVLTRDGEVVKIGSTLLNILIYLVENKDRVISYSEIGDQVLKEYDSSGDFKSLGVQISALRNILEASDYITNIRGVGYIFDTTKL